MEFYVISTTGHQNKIINKEVVRSLLVSRLYLLHQQIRHLASKMELLYRSNIDYLLNLRNLKINHNKIGSQKFSEYLRRNY